ncbi:hypothetical protein A2U01_0047112, partial [Trifolium medium]|nr:hypothetical protein [Trifolium medium]
MNEEVRTLKVYGKSTSHCYKVQVREKDLDKANLNSEWMEESHEEELTEPREYDVQTLKACREQGQEWVERFTVEINSRGPAVKNSRAEKEMLWHSKIVALGESITSLRSTM